MNKNSECETGDCAGNATDDGGDGWPDLYGENGVKNFEGNVEICRTFCMRWLQAWTGNEPAKLMELFHEDALFRDPAQPSGLRGREEIEGYIDILLSRNPGWRFTFIDMWVNNNGPITLKWRVSIPIGDGGDKFVDEMGVQLLELRDGLVWNCEIYMDRSEWTRAMFKETQYAED